MPRTETRPAVRPWVRLRVTMYRTAGPGTMKSSMAAATKRLSVVTSGMSAIIGRLRLPVVVYVGLTAGWGILGKGAT